MERFLQGHGLNTPFLSRLAHSYYECKHGSAPPRKAFDYYTAAVLCSAVAGTVAHIPASRKRLYYCGKYGVALVSNADGGWKRACDNYLERVAAVSVPADTDIPFIKAKKESFKSEADRLRGLEPLPGISVLDVKKNINSMFRLSRPSKAVVAGANAIRAVLRMQSHKGLVSDSKATD